MAIYVYNTVTGRLVSYCPNDTDPVAPAGTLAANGLTSISGLLPMDSTHAWNAVTKAVTVVAAPTEPQLITTFAWVLRWTPAQVAAARASADTTIAQFLFALSFTTVLDLTTPSISTFMAYLVTKAMLTAPQVTTIMAPPASINGP